MRRSRTGSSSTGVTGYADEAAAFLRRRRLTREPFARVYSAGGRAARFAPRPRRAAALFLAASSRDRRRRERWRREAPRHSSSPSSARAGPRASARPAAATSPSSSARTAPASRPRDRRVADRARPARRRARRRRPGGARRDHLLRPRRRARRAATSSAPPRRPPRRSRRSAARRRALEAAGPRRGVQEIAVAPADGPGRAQGRAAARLRRARARRRRRGRPGPGELRREPPPDHGRQLRRLASPPTTAPGCGSASRSSRGATSTVETGFETLGGHRGFELVERAAPAERIAEQAREHGADAARRRPGAGRRDAGRGRRRVRRRAVPRDDRPRPRGRPRPEGRLGLRGQARRAGRAEPFLDGLRRRPPARASGAPTRSTTRARRPSARP